MNKRLEAQRKGRVGERWAYDELRRRGYRVSMISDFTSPNSDLLIHFQNQKRLPTEVKLAYPTYRKPHPDGPWRSRWQFRLHPTAGCMLGEWLLILIAVDSSGHRHWYIIPGSLVGDRRHLQITSHPDLYGGWMGHYRSNWAVIDGLLHQEYEQLLDAERLAA